MRAFEITIHRLDTATRREGTKEKVNVGEVGVVCETLDVAMAK